MKHFVKILVLAIVFISCQKEYENVNEPDKRQAISADDNIADLILKVVLKDGSFDDIIDRCSEINIKFPYSILVDDQLLQINSLEDIEVLYIDYFHYRDDIEINYPITVIYSDYSEAVLDDSDELEEIQEQVNTDLPDDDIECIDFIYPVEITIFNTAYQKADHIVANNDAEMNDVFQDLSDIILEIEYPIQVTTHNDNTILVADNFDLENQINEFKNSCDENDNVEFSDEDHPLSELLRSGTWKVSLYSDTSDVTQSFSPFSIEFKPDFSMLVTGNSETISGEWEFDLYDNVKMLEFELDTDEIPLVWLNDDWEVLAANNSEVQMQAESDFDGHAKKLNLIKRE